MSKKDDDAIKIFSFAVTLLSFLSRDSSSPELGKQSGKEAGSRPTSEAAPKPDNGDE